MRRLGGSCPNGRCLGGHGAGPVAVQAQPADHHGLRGVVHRPLRRRPAPARLQRHPHRGVPRRRAHPPRLGAAVLLRLDLRPLPRLLDQRLVRRGHRARADGRRRHRDPLRVRPLRAGRASGAGHLDHRGGPLRPRHRGGHPVRRPSGDRRASTGERRAPPPGDHLRRRRVRHAHAPDAALRVEQPVPSGGAARRRPGEAQPEHQGSARRGRPEGDRGRRPAVRRQCAARGDPHRRRPDDP